MPCFLRLKKRRFFQEAALKGARVSSAACILQAKPYGPEKTGPCFFGFTATRRLGKSTDRNKAKRRLRASVLACRHYLESQQKAFVFENGYHYVFIAKKGVFFIDFDDLTRQMSGMLMKVQRF